MPSPRFNHGFENDVFISYCHIDDESDPSGRRWISKFETDLKTLLEQNSGRSVRIWRDPKLGSADRFDEEIMDQLRTSAVLVAILTPSYFNSEFCGKEWREFIRIAPDLGNTRRIMKVAKTHVPLEQYPKELLATAEHRFFVQEPNGHYREYHRHPDPQFEREYHAHVDDVAQEMEGILNRMQGAAASPELRGTVYVGETSSDLNADRDHIRRILKQLGYDVVPKTTLAGLTAPEIREIVARDLTSSSLAIILVGANYGSIPELGGEASVVRIQLEVAASDGRGERFPRLVWMPKGLTPAESRQRQLIQEIREKWVRQPFEVLECLVYHLQDVLEVRLNPPKNKVERTPSEPERPSVYVLSEREDIDAAQAVRQFLFEQDFEVPGPPENWTDPAALREELRRRFIEDHAFLVYYGQTTESWVREKIKEISKADGLDRKSPILARAVFLADPATVNKKHPLLREKLLLPGFAPAPLGESLAPFVSAIREGWSSQVSKAAQGGFK